MQEGYETNGKTMDNNNKDKIKLAIAVLKKKAKNGNKKGSLAEKINFGGNNKEG